jgi:hypothetical protein
MRLKARTKILVLLDAQFCSASELSNKTSLSYNVVCIICDCCAVKVLLNARAAEDMFGCLRVLVRHVWLDFDEFARAGRLLTFGAFMIVFL